MLSGILPNQVTSYLSNMVLCKTVAAAYEHSVVSVVEEFDDSAGDDKDDKPPASQSAWRYCNPQSFADFAGRRVSLLVEVLENYLHEQTNFHIISNKKSYYFFTFSFILYIFLNNITINFATISFYL